ncbi:DedA family protein [Ornithinibacillus halotolerans]|uniref:Alkaline phosphatase-like protein n=1 Tax=Ornithinibacillus halotolerans TaxID=1274357 RepID=A0A916S0U3_9BACI|nr:DedA family protein [Ornithinibacillus halotolerans]GGA77072.1 alkaline phosphatase-like protein [Ornithinibacillus halotolerans]
MQEWVTGIMEQFGYIGIFFMMALENVFPPIPSEIVLPFGGFMTTNSELTVVGVIITATSGSVLGAIILYGIGLLIDVGRLEKIVDRWGHIIRIKKEDIHKADAWFDKYGYWTVLFCRMIPLIRSLISVPAGMSNMNFTLFLLFTLIGTLIWNIILIMIGVLLGENWHSILGFMETYSTITYASIAIGFIVLVFIFIRKRIRK